MTGAAGNIKDDPEAMRVIGALRQKGYSVEQVRRALMDLYIEDAAGEPITRPLPGKPAASNPGVRQ